MLLFDDRVQCQIVHAKIPDTSFHRPPTNNYSAWISFLFLNNPCTNCTEISLLEYLRVLGRKQPSLTCKKLNFVTKNIQAQKILVKCLSSYAFIFEPDKSSEYHTVRLNTT